MRIDDRELIQLIENLTQHAEGSDWASDGMAEERELAWDYYLGRTNNQVPALSEQDGISSVKHTLVHDYVNAVIAQMVPSLANDNPCSFERLGPDDDMADAESKAVNQVLMEDMPGFQILYGGAKSAALFGNAFAKVQCVERVVTDVRTFSGVSPEDVRIAVGEDVDIEADGDQVTVSASRVQKRIEVSLVEPANFAYPRNWHEMDFQDSPFTQERHVYRRDELIGMGYDRAKVAALEAAGPSYRIAQNAGNVDKQYDYNEAEVKNQDRVEVYETYIRLNMANTESPEGELWRVVHSGQTVLEKEPAKLVPYVTGTLYLRLFSCKGESLYEKLRPLQDQATGLTRSLMDTAQENSNLGLIVNDQVHPEDLGDRAVGQDVRCQGDVRAAAMPIPVMDMSAGTLAAIDKVEQLAAKRAGASLDLQTGEAQSIDKQIGAVATQQLIGHQELQAATLTRTFAETFVRSLFKLIHDTMRYEYGEPVNLTLSGEAVTLNPGEWPERTRINVKTGMSPGERNRKLANLQFVLQTEMALMQAGMPMTDPKTLHAVLTDYMKAADLDGGERYFNDPMSRRYQEVEAAAAQAAQQSQQTQMQLATMGDEVKVLIAKMDDATKRLDIAAKVAIAESKNATDIGTAEISAASAVVNSGAAEAAESGGSRAN